MLRLAVVARIPPHAELLTQAVHAALASAADDLRDLLETASGKNELDAVDRELRRVMALFNLLRRMSVAAG